MDQESLVLEKGENPGQDLLPEAFSGLGADGCGAAHHCFSCMPGSHWKCLLLLGTLAALRLLIEEYVGVNG